MQLHHSIVGTRTRTRKMHKKRPPSGLDVRRAQPQLSFSRKQYNPKPPDLGHTCHFSNTLTFSTFVVSQYQLPTMHITALLATLVFATTALASPHVFAPRASVVPQGTNGGDSRKRNHTHHKEHTPTFKKKCNCQLPVIPANLLSANERCLMKQSAQMGCFMSSNGGCPSPAPAVSETCSNSVKKMNLY